MTAKTPRQTTPAPNIDGWQRSIDEADGEWDSHDCGIRSALRMANFSFQSVPDADTRTYEVVVRGGDTLNGIARAHGSTPEVMKKLNPSARMLRPGEVLRYQRASVQRVITGWKPITASSVATYYNAGGDAVYASKLGHALTAVHNKAGAAACR